MTTAYTADELLEQVRRGGSLPSAASTGTADADLLAHADAELRDTLVPLMLGVHEEFYERPFDQTVTSGINAYRINKRAALSRINTVQWVASDTSVFNLVRYEPKEVVRLGLLASTQGMPYAYYLQGSTVVMYPTPNLSGTLRIRAFVRPSRLCLLADNTATNLAISAVSVGASVTTLTTAAHGITTSGIRDVVASTPSFEHIVVDATATVTAATTVTIPNTDFSATPVVGDQLCVSDNTPYVQLPVEMQPALVELTIARVLRALGKGSEAADHEEKAQALVGIAIQALTPRVETAERKILGGPHYRRGRGAGLWTGR